MTHSQTDPRRVFNLLGMAMRARMLSLGMTATLKSLDHNQVHLLVLAADLGQSARLKIQASADKKKIPVRVFGTKDELGQCFGRNEVGVIGVTDSGFAESLRSA